MTSQKTATRKNKGNARPENEVHGVAKEVIKYLETHAGKVDKATIAKYVAVAVLVMYGIRKSSILRSMAVTLITAMVAKFLAESQGSAEGVDTGEAADSAS